MNFTMSRELLRWMVVVGFYLPLILLIDWRCWRRDVQVPVYAETAWWARGLLYAVAVLMVLYLGTPDVVPFIYFQF